MVDVAKSQGLWLNFGKGFDSRRRFGNPKADVVKGN